MAKDDAVKRLIELLRAVYVDSGQPAPADGLLTSYAQRIHADMGGTRQYFPKAPALGKALRLGELRAAGVPFAQAYRQIGMSSAAAYRAIHRRRRWAR